MQGRHVRLAISIHVPREGHDKSAVQIIMMLLISIHVPREGHDTTRQMLRLTAPPFQSTCPARGTTRVCIAAANQNLRFQSTCPARGTTFDDTGFSTATRDFNPRAPRGARRPIKTSGIYHANFNPRAPRGARLLQKMQVPAQKTISIHVPREGHDVEIIKPVEPTPISIHVPREGHDLAPNLPSLATLYFNPRAPRGARRNIFIISFGFNLFQSTCPARGTTLFICASYKILNISIHVPREGHDFVIKDFIFAYKYFNPRAPRGARPFSSLRSSAIIQDFNPRAPRGARH